MDDDTNCPACPAAHAEGHGACPSCGIGLDVCYVCGGLGLHRVGCPDSEAAMDDDRIALDADGDVR